MILSKRQAGERILAEDYNKLVEQYNASAPVVYDATKRSILYGLASEVVEAYSIFEVMEPAAIETTEQQGVTVGIRRLTADNASLFLTNGTFVSTAGQLVPLEPLDSVFKVRVSSADSGLKIGLECGPKKNSYEFSSDSNGFVCLSAILQHSDTVSYIWATPYTARTKLIGKTTAIVPGATLGATTLTFSTAPVRLWKLNAGQTQLVETTLNMEWSHMAPQPIAAGKFVHAFPMGRRLVIDFELCDA